MTPELKKKLAGRRVIASISGGKDSAAMSLYLTEVGIEHDRVFADTGWEHPKTYEYLRGPLTEKLGPIAEVCGPRTMPELIRHKGMFAARIRRFCTEELKVKPLLDYFQALPPDCDYVNAVGIRGAESAARAKLSEWEWSDAFDCEVWRPLIAWTEQDVIDIHKRHGLQPNPLYLMGATRVGCWPCIFASKKEIRLIAERDPERIAEIRELENEVNAARAARYSGGVRRDATFFTLRPDGKTHVAARIDDVVAWSKSGRGGDSDDAARDGCMRWGLCEVGSPCTEATDVPPDVVA